MKSLVKKILTEKDFIIEENILEDEHSFLASRTENNKFDFLTVMPIRKDEINREALREKIERYLLKIIETKQTLVGLEKNLSLLVLLEVDSLDISKEISSLIYDIEEDPYDFKKYVLVYTNEQVSLLESYKGTSEGDIIPYINNILNNSHFFAKFKSNEESEDVLIYDLVSKLFIKIPFLSIDNNQQIITNLLDEIVESIQAEDKVLWESFLKLNETSGSDPNIEEILNCIGVGKGE